MFQTFSIRHTLLLPLIATLMLACTEKIPVPDETPEQPLVSVNGIPITETDLNIQLNREEKDHDEMIKPGRNKELLENIILQELISQQALKLGLDSDPSYRKELKGMEAQVNARKRKRLTGLFRHDIWETTTISEQEATTYFAENESRLKTEVKVWKIMRRNEKEIRRDLADLASGTSFEEVAARRFPKLPQSMNKPWILDYLNWQQFPEVWWSALDEMEVGETSGIITTGQNHRFWIIKLIDRRQNPELDYQKNQARIKEILKQEKVEKRRQQSERELREQANIVYLKSVPIDQALGDE